MSASRFSFLFAGCLFATAAQAFIDPPVLLPPDPTDADELIVSTTVGQCDTIDPGTDHAFIVVDGGTITLRVDGVRHHDPLWCFFPVLERHFPIGTYPAGEYTLIAQFRYEHPAGFLPPIVEEFGRVEFTVTGTEPPAPAYAVPSGTPWGWLVLGGGVVYLAWRRRRRWRTRQRSRSTPLLDRHPTGTMPRTVTIGRCHHVLFAHRTRPSIFCW